MCEIMIGEIVGVFDYKSGNSQGILIHVFSMNPEQKWIWSHLALTFHFNIHENKAFSIVPRKKVQYILWKVFS